MQAWQLLPACRVKAHIDVVMIPWCRHDNKITAESTNQRQQILKFQHVNLCWLEKVGETGSSAACQKKGQTLFCLLKLSSHKVSHKRALLQQTDFHLKNRWKTDQSQSPTVTLPHTALPTPAKPGEGSVGRTWAGAKVFLKPLMVCQKHKIGGHWNAEVALLALFAPNTRPKINFSTQKKKKSLSY